MFNFLYLEYRYPVLSLASSISASLVRDLFSLLLPELPDVSVFRRFRFLPVFFLQVDPVVVSSRRNGDIVLKCDIGNKVTNEPTAVYVEFDCLAVDQCGNCEEFGHLYFLLSVLNGSSVLSNGSCPVTSRLLPRGCLFTSSTWFTLFYCTCNFLRKDLFPPHFARFFPPGRTFLLS